MGHIGCKLPSHPVPLAFLGDIPHQHYSPAAAMVGRKLYDSTLHCKYSFSIFSLKGGQDSILSFRERKKCDEMLTQFQRA